MEKKTSFIRDVDIDTDIEMRIPDWYVTNIQERLSLYTELDTLESEEQIQSFSIALKDRFGAIPHEVEELFDGLKIRFMAKNWVLKESF